MRKATFKQQKVNGVYHYTAVNKNARLGAKALTGLLRGELDRNDLRTIYANGKQPCHWDTLEPINL